MNIQKFINLAREEAKKGNVTEWSHGAVIVKGNRIIGRGHNRFSGKIVQFEQRYQVTLFSLHAELAGILDCDESVDGASIFVSGIKSNGKRVLCRPCKKCMHIIRKMPFKAIYYETKSGIEAIIL